MKHIVCFYWQGDRWQEKAGHIPNDVAYQNHLKRSGLVSRSLAQKYINNLFLGATRFTKTPFKFICFSNEELPDLLHEIEVRKFKMATTKGVLPRMYMFSSEANLMGSTVLSLDLDVIITGPLDNLLNYNGQFCTRKSWTKGEETLIDGDVMCFRANDTMRQLFWEPLVQVPVLVEAITQGRERAWVRHCTKHWESVDTWQDLIPGEVLSYKYHVMENAIVPKGANIISCHGYPRPHQITQGWRMEYWK